MSSVRLYFDTIRHLRPVQIYGRAWHRLHRPRPDLRPAPPRRPQAAPWPAPPLRAVSLVAPDRLLLLNEERSIAGAAAWNGAHDAALWMYNLHYFDDLNAPDDPAREAWQRDLIARWVRENPPGEGVGWDPYPTSLRIVSWIRWLLRGHAAVPGMLHSLAVQARHLRRRLEHFILGNHLFVNAKALAVAGTFFAGDEADGWLAEGRRLLEREIAEQILGDGGHFERSPMYHALLLEDLLDLLALDRAVPGTGAPVDALARTASAMIGWLRAMTHPDGGIALFNDATTGVAAAPDALLAAARALGVEVPPAPGPGTVDLPATGYTRVELGGAVLLADTGALGPDYLPGHGHADTLSFELSIAGRRVLVDSGVSEYGTAPERVRQRGTAAHNTVLVDGLDSSEVWSGFRVARRARVHDRRVAAVAGAATIEAWHDGYHRLPGRVAHRRRWEVDAGVITIDDDVTGGGRHRVELLFHLAPGLEPHRTGDETWELAAGLRLEVDARLAWEAAPGTVHRAMGERAPAWILRGVADTLLPVHARTRILWDPS
ncbi:MAG TPA: alginate lyase family protein [Kofleriaceae bacterium]|nr:alginate lyase family protein [Kofleriaceae bacterium]